MRLLLSLIGLTLLQPVLSQEPIDALRYSMIGNGGTARARAIGGAVTSLGGDISTAMVNPAGLAFFKTNEFVFTPSLGLNSTRTNYLNGDAKSKKTAFDINNLGVVMPRDGSMNGNWRNFTFGVGINRSVNFNNQTRLKGINNESSYSEKYLEELINNNVTDPNRAATQFPFGSSLALNTYLIDTVSGPGGTVRGYRSLATPQTGVIQDQRVDTKGSLNDYFIAASGNFQDRLYIGGALTFNRLEYERTITYRESDATNNKNNNFNYFETVENLLTEGLGVGVKLGLIVRPVQQLRVGFSYHSPIFYNLDDFYSTSMTTDVEGFQGQGVLKQSSYDLNNGEPGEFQYDYRTPSRMNVGISYVFQEVEDVTKQRGFISADAEFINYGKSRFSTASTANGVNYLDELNKAVGEQFRSAVNLRVGGELKFNTLMVRAGYNSLSNAYSNGALKSAQTNISGGIGYRNKGYIIDLTYVHQLISDVNFPYKLDNGFFAPGTVKGNNGNVFLTFGMKF
ncbi:MAG: OmpP1/FadL family transporter [Chitinophagaceae bacterium]|jgi:long-subunit fatty acid transport protein